MKYYVYRTYFLPTGQEYTGKTNSVEWDKGYHGSGEDLKPLLEVHGKENFKREILHIFDDEDEAYAKERELVTLAYCKLDYVLNQMPGGKGGLSGVPHTPKQKENHLKAVQSEEFRENQSKDSKERWKDEEYRKKIIESVKKTCNSPEFKENRSNIATELWKDEEYRNKLTGENNYGWIQINWDDFLFVLTSTNSHTATAKHFGFKSSKTTASKLNFLENKLTKQQSLF